MPQRRLQGSAGVAVALVAAAVSAAWIDRPLTEWVVRWPEPVLVVFGALTHVGHSTKYLVAGGLLALFFHFAVRHVRARAASLLVFGAIALPGLLVNLLKIVIGRPRPHRWLGKQEWGLQPLTVDYDYSSMPSGHSSTVFGLAVALSVLFPRWRLLWWSVAVVVGFSRVAVEAHYLSDVIVGATLGVLMASVWVRLMRRWGLLQPGSAGPG